MSWGFTAAAVGTVVGAKLSSNASNKAAKAQRAAAERGQDLVSEAANRATTLINAQFPLSRGSLKTAQRNAAQQLRSTGVDTSNIISKGFQEALREIDIGAAGARQDIQTGVGRALAPLQPLQETGLQAQQRAAALSGGLGPEAQQQAISEFQASPGQQFLLEEAERASVRNAAATGGLGGGNIRRELQRQAIGFASQGLQQQIQNQLALGQTGIAAAQGISGLEAGQGEALANITGQRGVNLANIQQQLGSQLGGVTQQEGINQANLTTQLGQQLAQSRQQQAIAAGNVAIGAGTQQAELAGQAGAAQAAGILGQGAAQQQLIGGLSNLAGQAFNRPLPSQQGFFNVLPEGNTGGGAVNPGAFGGQRSVSRLPPPPTGLR